MSNILETITLILKFILGVFSSVLEWSLSQPIIAVCIYLPIVTFLIISVFSLVSGLFKHKSSD